MAEFEDFYDLVKKYKGTTAHDYSQLQDLGHFRGPDCLARLAEVMGGNQEPGFCFGLCMFYLEQLGRDSRFYNNLYDITSRAKVRGYQKLQAVAEQEGNTRSGLSKIAQEILSPDYDHVQFVEGGNVDVVKTCIQNNLGHAFRVSLKIKNVQKMAWYKRNKKIFSGHGICIMDINGRVRFFDPNWGSALLTGASNLGGLFEEFVKVFYPSTYYFCCDAFKPK